MKNSFLYLFRNESILLIALLLIILTFSFYSHTHTQTLASACNWKVQFCGPIHAPPGNTNFLKRIMESIPLFGETCTPGAFVTGVTKEGVLVCKKIETHGVCASLPEGTPPTTANACESGAYHNTPTDTPTHYRFHCNGIGGGNNASCTIKKPSCPSITKQWTQGSNTCTTTIPTTDSGSTTTAQDTTLPLTGTALYSCTSGVWTTPLSSKTCTNTTPINGQCGTTNNNCTAGTLNDIADTSSQYQWQCTGQNGGSDSGTCQKAIPVSPSSTPTVTGIDGQCGSPKNSCRTGTFRDETDTSAAYFWYCDGENGGSDDGCYKFKPSTPPTPINGLCGSSINSCTAGTFRDYTDSSLSYVWLCGGKNGGSSKACYKRKLINGWCGNSRNSCTAGIFRDLVDNSTTYFWYCKGRSGGASDFCSKEK